MQVVNNLVIIKVMNTLNLKALIYSLTLALSCFAICPSIMFLQSRDFDKKVAELKNRSINSARTLAVLEAK